MAENSPLSSFFDLERYQTTIRTEVLAGVTTFFTMAYILVVNPGILSDGVFLTESGDLFPELAFATAVSAMLATLFMGLYAKLPFALAPGMGLNAYFTYGVILGLGIDWRVALAAVFIEGILFVILTLTNVRTYIVRIIPTAIKHAITAGIGIFIAYIGLKAAGIITESPATTTTLGDLRTPSTAIAIWGIVITSALLARRIKGALLWGILATAIPAWIFAVAPWPEALIGLPRWPGALVGQAVVGLGSAFSGNLVQLLTVVIALLFVDLFDTIGTLTGLGSRAGYIQEDGTFPNVEKAFMADALGTTVGAVLGTSTVTTYIESASGISEGGRSGLTAVVVAALFLLSLLFTPLFVAIPAIATAPALIMVGVLMMSSVRFIQWDDLAEAIPAFLTIVMMPLSYSIADGLAVGLILYPLVKAFQGKASETNIGMWVLAAIFVLHFIFI